MRINPHRVISAQKEAQKQIEGIHKRVKREEKSEIDRLENLKQKYAQLREAEKQNLQESLQDLQESGYEKLRKQRKLYRKKAQTIQREKGYETRKLTKDAQREIQKLNKKNSREIQDYLKQKDTIEKLRSKKEGTLRNQFEKDITSLEEDFALKKNHIQEKLSQDLKHQLESEKVQQDERMQTLENRFQKQYRNTLEEFQKNLSTLQAEAQKQVYHLQADQAQKLEHMWNKQEDPFYQLVALEPEVTDMEDKLLIEVSIPPHEEKNISVMVQGNRLVLLGTRQNALVQKSEDGSTEKTSSYQTYSTAIPIREPLDANHLKRHYDGEVLWIEVPKKKFS